MLSSRFNRSMIWTMFYVISTTGHLQHSKCSVIIYGFEIDNAQCLPTHPGLLFERPAVMILIWNVPPKPHVFKGVWLDHGAATHICRLIHGLVHLLLEDRDWSKGQLTRACGLDRKGISSSLATPFSSSWLPGGEELSFTQPFPPCRFLPWSQPARDHETK